ncbi:MAG: CocE/NonD family hydrolase [Planctomycetes bacterium]|nr:CocE/NonD family hydrolase [Planctomycetota bacterium]
MKFGTVLALLGLTLAIAARGAEAQDTLQARYEKREVLIPMRDGVRLFTSIYLPRDRSQRWPILMRRTPYGVRPYGADAYPQLLGPHAAFDAAGYAFVLQDVRGCYRSEGEFVNVRPHRTRKATPQEIDESSDTYDTIEWLLANLPESNGRVGMWGISYPGFYAAAGMIDAHPALKAVSPQAPVADWWYDDFRHHGAFFLAHAFNFFARFGKVRPEPTSERSFPFAHGTRDGYAFFLGLGRLIDADERWYGGGVPFWDELLQHDIYDEFWRERNIVPHLKNVAPAVLTVGGWYDAEDLYGPLAIYHAVEQRNPGIENSLVMGPWVHGGWARGTGESLGDLHFGAARSLEYQRDVELPFFERHLRERRELPPPAEATVFDTGSLQWQHLPRWPPADAIARPLYFRERSSLAFARPEQTTGEVRDSFVSDPAKPVPFSETISVDMLREYMVDDQRFAARRPDVLVYELPVLEQDLVVAGPVQVELWVSTTERDADWIVKLIDVHPHDAQDTPATRPGRAMSSYHQHVRGEVFRGRFRERADKAVPFEPNVPALVRFPLWDVLHTFKKGHRLQLQVQSTWFPLVDRNPQRWVEHIHEAQEEDFVRATHTLHRSALHASRVLLPVRGGR